MASWAWPHTPVSNWARLVLVGPYGNIDAGFLPPDVGTPAEIAWTDWYPWGMACYVYRWRGQRLMERGRTAALLYEPAYRRVDAEDIPPVVGKDADLYADAADLLLQVRGFPLT